VPQEALPFTERFIKSTWELNLNQSLDDMSLCAKLVPVQVGDEFRWGKKDLYTVKVFKCFHEVPCVGYAFSENRYRLKEEYRNLPGKELGQLRKENVQINEEYQVNLFVYIGDTSTQVFEENPWLFSYPVIVTECTFFMDERDRAQQTGHTHWEDLKPYILAHPSTRFVLIHFSLRYKEQEVLDFFTNLTQGEDPLDLSNVVIFVGEGSAPKQ